MSQDLTVVVPIVPGVPGRTLIDVAEAMASGQHGKAVVLSVVEVPEDRSLSEGVSPAQRRREVLRRLGGTESSSPEVRVRAARSFETGVREAVQELQADVLLLGWRGSMRSENRLRRGVYEPVILHPPCDVAIFKPGKGRRNQMDGTPTDEQRRTATAGASGWPPSNVLVPIRGGPHAQLALRLGERVAQHFRAQLTVLLIHRAGAEPNGAAEVLGPDNIECRYPRCRIVEVINDSIEEAILAESATCDLLILGASARGPRASHLVGSLPERLADLVACNVMVVRTAEPLSLEMFGVPSQALHSVTHESQASISTIVDQWFAQNTFHSHEFEDVRQLVNLKERQGTTISVALPALNEEATIGKVISTIKQRLMIDVPLVDEMIVVDSASEDRTVEIAENAGVPVFSHPDILPRYGSHVGKGEGLWKSLYLTSGDIVVWIDSDITDIHPKFVYGLVGPLLTNPQLGFIKGYYRRPLNLGGEQLSTGGGRVTELTARPLINLFYPLLSGLVQPLAGEMAGRRSLLERLPFFTGYGVETGLLIDILERFGLDHLGQTDLENRIHRNQDMISLSKMAFAIVQVVIRRLEDQRHISLLEEMNTTMKLIHYSPNELFLEVKEIRERERPPMIELPEYVHRHASHVAAGAGG